MAKTIGLTYPKPKKETKEEKGGDGK